MKWVIVLLVLLSSMSGVYAACAPGDNFTVINSTHIEACNCTQEYVQYAIDNTTDGMTVMVPAGNCIWGNSSTYISVNKKITLQGAGTSSTIINLSDTAGSYTSGTIRISDAATVKDFKINTPTTGNSKTAFSVSGDNFCIYNIDYTCGTTSINGYFAYIGSYGVISGCNITGGSGSQELIFARGPTDSWQTEDSIGGMHNLFIENNTFQGYGYVCDINSNGRAVVRHNTMHGSNKIDGHGKASNSPPRGFRHMEAYDNLWTATNSYWVAITYRGGTGVIFNNNASPGATGIWFILTDYGYTAAWPNFNNTCQCPSDYPVDDQIGVGMDPKAVASAPLYIWNNSLSGATWDITFLSTSSCTPTCGDFNISDVIQNGTDYIIATKPNYEPFDYPHPLVSGIPGVSLLSPVNSNCTNETTIEFNCSIIDSGNLTNVTLYGNWSGGWHANETVSINGSYNETTFTKTLSEGNYIWNCLAYDEDGNTDWANLNYSLTLGNGTFSPLSAKAYYNITAPIENVINSTGYHVWNRTPESSDIECSFDLEATI